MKRELVLIAHNLRSCHNAGSLLRTADGLGVAAIYLTGYTPYPFHDTDVRLPHIREKLHRQIQKTSLGAERTVKWHHEEDITAVINSLKAEGFQVVALEQHRDSTSLPESRFSDKVALIIGREVEGIEENVLALADLIVEIPMYGQKESYNVVQAAAMAMYHLRFV